MVDFKKVQFNKLWSILIIGIIISGIILRFYHQFFNWSFNGDEVNLGLDILNHSFSELFSPFQSRQSAPPLFLLLEKISSQFFKPYISFKIISFLASCASIFLFNRILKNSFSLGTHIIILALFCFNPFVLSNSLTLKQYSIDLMMGLIAINYFVYGKHLLKTFLFFCFFCLISNVGLFFSASFIIYSLVNYIWNEKERMLDINIKLKKISPYLFAPFPYLLFFLWFINEPGANNMKNYMVHFWNGSFMPLDFSIFRWFAIQAKVICIFFFSSYWFIAAPMLLLFLFGIVVVFKHKQQIFQNSIYCTITLYLITVSIHLFLSALKLYPFSDRLFLYIAPGIYLIFGLGIDYISKKNWKSLQLKSIQFLSLFTPLFAIVLYTTYLPEKSNNVYALVELMKSNNSSFFFTPKAKQRSLQWLAFTKYFDEDYSYTFKTIEDDDYKNNDTDQLLIAVQSEKFGHGKKYSSPEPEIVRLLEQDKIVLYKRVEGYAIYKFK